MSEENETLREAALAAIEEERDGQTLSAELPDEAEDTSEVETADATEEAPAAFEGMSASDVGGAVVPAAAQIETEDEGAARGPVEDTGITADETEAAVEAGEVTEDDVSGYEVYANPVVYLLTSASYGVVGQGVHVVGVFESEEAAAAYRDGAEPRVSDGVIEAYAVFE